MDLMSIVNEICDQADDFLAGVSRRDEAKAGIAEMLTMHHLRLSPADKKAVIDQVMQILDREGFFQASGGGGGDDGVVGLEEM
jgi:hypothetical protein